MSGVNSSHFGLNSTVSSQSTLSTYSSSFISYQSILITYTSSSSYIPTSLPSPITKTSKQSSTFSTQEFITKTSNTIETLNPISINRFNIQQLHAQLTSSSLKDTLPSTSIISLSIPTTSIISLSIPTTSIISLSIPTTSIISLSIPTIEPIPMNAKVSINSITSTFTIQQSQSQITESSTPSIEPLQPYNNNSSMNTDNNIGLIIGITLSIAFILLIILYLFNRYIHKKKVESIVNEPINQNNKLPFDNEKKTSIYSMNDSFINDDCNRDTILIGHTSILSEFN